MTYVTTAPTFVPGEVVTATKMNALADGIQAAWTAFTPAWTGSVTNPTLGNGTLTAYYIQVGKTVHYTIRVAMGSTTTYGSGTWSFGLPVSIFASPAGVSIPAANVLLSDNSTGGLQVGLTIASSAGAMSFYTPAVPAVAVDATHPFTWATSDVLLVSGTYQAA